MSDLDDLIEAAQRKPTSGLLRAIVTAATESRSEAMAAAFFGTLDASAQDGRTRESVTKLLLAAGAYEAAAVWSSECEGALAILYARALLGLGRRSDARDSYLGALAVFPHLRDATLDEELSQRHAQITGGNVVSITAAGRSAGPSPAAAPEADPKNGKVRIGFADIGGLDDVKTQIRRKIILPFERKGLFERFRKRSGGGVLLYGPPGCGKTMLARATATECGAEFVSVEITDIIDKYIGESEKRIAAVFAQARTKRPSVIFFDEVEALAARRRYSDYSSHQAPLVSTFLNEMDGFAGHTEGLLVLAATNVPWAIDAAFRRPGRFDRAIFIPPPDRAARQAILGIELKGRPAEPNLPLGEIADKTVGFSGADLTNLVETACDLAIERSIAEDNVAPVCLRDLRKALGEVKPTTSEWLTQARNYAKFANEGGFYDDVVAFLDRHGR